MTPLLEARQLRFGPPLTGLGPLALSVGAGQSLRIEGPSGCGKTTVLRALARLAAHEQAEILLRGVSATRIAPVAWRSVVAYLPQSPVMLPGTVGDNLAAAFGTRARRDKRFEPGRAGELMARLGLSGGALMGRNAQLLSGGEAARVALCRALLVDPSLLLADEICAMLDARSARAVVDLCREFLAGGGAIVLVAHDHGPWADLAQPPMVLRLAGQSESSAPATGANP